MDLKQSDQARRYLTYIGLILTLILGSFALRSTQWQTIARTHTVFEAVATFFALFVGVIALVRYYSQKHLMFLFVGLGFFGAALLDSYHTVVTSTTFSVSYPTTRPSLIPWSWMASRVFLSLLLFSMGWLVWPKKKHFPATYQVSEGLTYAFVIVLTVASLSFFVFVPLPRQIYYPGQLIPRPWELMPAFFFLLATALILRQGHWRASVFTHWLVLALIINTYLHFPVMAFSNHLFDTLFNVAHILKIWGYAMVSMGLLISTYHLFKRAEASNQQLEIEIRERKKSEMALALARDQALEAKNIQERATELMVANHALEKAKEVAEIANEAKSVFLANMSHELRTPLNSILGYAQILKQDQQLSTAQFEGIRAIQKSGEHLLTLINDILDLSQIESGKLDLVSGDIHLRPFLVEITDLLRIRAKEKRIDFILDPDPALPLGIRADQTRLRQVLVNLINNAIKFTDHGSVILRAKPISSITQEPQLQAVGQHQLEIDAELSQTVAPLIEQLTIRFEIVDTGIGIMSQDLAKIFEPFEQVQGSQRQLEGTGLGLAITQQILALMDSELQVKSDITQGSTFWFDLTVPVAQVKFDEAPSKEWRISGYTGKVRSILIVDDKLENRQILTMMLAPLGFETIEANDGQAALEQVQRLKPDLILMDLIMPRLDGFAATQAIRQRTDLSNIVIIAVSASAFEQDRQRSLLAGCDAFLPKPINEKTLLDTLAHFLALDWIYEETASSVVGENGHQETKTPEIILSTLSEEEVEAFKALQEAARLGNMRRIRESADHLDQLDERFAAFTSRIRILTRQFDDQQILTLVDSLMNEAQNL